MVEKLIRGGSWGDNGFHFVTLNHHTYDPGRVVAAHYKKSNFNRSYPHTMHAHKDKIRNWYNAAREFNPNEQQEKDDG